MKLKLLTLAVSTLTLIAIPPPTLAKKKTTTNPEKKPEITESSNPAAANPTPEYSLGNEFLKQLFESIEKDKFYPSINLDMSFSNDTNNTTTYNVLDIDATLQFKRKTNGINVSIFAPKTNPTDEDKKLDFKFKVDVSGKIAVLHLAKGDHNNEFSGDIRFYSFDNNRNFKPDSVNLKISNDLLDIKELRLEGATVKIILPEKTANPRNDAENKQLKKSLLKALIECKAESLVADSVTGEVGFEPLEKCLFSFDGERLRVQYKDAKRTLPHQLL
jgi:hypothetical protein